MPVGPYKTFGQCVAAQKRKGHSDESARKICGKMEADSKETRATLGHSCGPRLMKSYQLTPGIVSSYAGSNVVCLHPDAIGQLFKLYDARPGPGLNRRVARVRSSATIVSPDGIVSDGPTEEIEEPVPVTIVRIDGVIEQRAGYHDMCAGWSDGHDTIAERMIAALEVSDVLLIIDSPGGAHAGLQQAIEHVEREKAEHGRRVVVWADEMIGSAAYWWAACVGDEIYAPESGIVGSIGVRAGHKSEAGALEKSGVEVTYFAWPGAGKVAFAPELPLSDIGKQRGERDTAAAGEAFAAAVGPRRGMTREEIVELDADCLSGQMAVSAKLVDGIDTFENVLDYCIASAERSQNSEERDMDPKEDTSISPAVRTEGDDPEPGKEPDGVCKVCGHQNEMDSKYCDQCGKSMAAQPLPEPEEEEDEPEKEEEGGEPEKEEKRMAPPPPQKEIGASFAGLLGLRDGASELAIKTALVRKLQVVDYVAAITGTDVEDRMLGQLRAVAEDARESGKLRRQLGKVRTQAEARERMDLLKSLVAANLPDYPRGNLLIDEVGENGRIVETKPAPAYAEMKIETLRGLVKGKLANAAPRSRVMKSPFEPSAESAQKIADQITVEEASKNPVVQKVARNGVDPKVAAGIFAREFGVRAVIPQGAK